MAYILDMRQKRRRGITKAPTYDDSPGIDLGASARQIGLFESANGVPHGITAIAIAFIAALMLFPVRAIWRALTSRDRRNDGP